jgi:aminocarboxymuconate-semialdehyde decarboxylase
VSIDFHAHILPPDWPDLARRYGDDRWPRLDHVDACSAKIMVKGEVFREVTQQCYRVERRLEDMAAAGVERQVLSTVPVMFSYWAAPRDARDLCRYLNEHIAETVRDHPRHFSGLGTVPLRDPDLAVEELERCVGELGLVGVEIGTNVDGTELDDPRLRPFFRRAAELGAVVFVHPWQVLGSRRLTQYYFLYTVAMPSETAFAFGALIFGGVLEEVPDLKLVFAHGGGSVPYILPRMERGWDVWAPAREHTRERPSAYLGRCWFDSITWDSESLEFLVKRVGADRVLFGTDYPFLMGEDRPGELVAESGLETSQKDAILTGNCTDLLALGRSGGATTGTAVER